MEKILQKSFQLNKQIIIHPAKNEIQFLKEGQPNKKLEPRIMQLLVCLASEPGEVFSREQLLETVWGEHSSLEEVLTLGISRLRKALGDAARSPAFIQTVPKKGYRLIANVEPILEEKQSKRPLKQAKKDEKIKKTIALLLGIVAVFIAVFVKSASKQQALFMPPSLLPITNAHGLEIHPTVSPNGHYLAFSGRKKNDNDFDLFVKEMPAAQLYNLSQLLEGDCMSPAWSPKGDEIAFVHYNNGRVILKKIEITTKKVTSLLEFHPKATPELDWSSDGRYLVFTDKVSDNFLEKIFLYDLHQKQKIAFSTAATYEYRPIFSLDASRLIFIRKIAQNHYQIIEKDIYSQKEKILKEEQKRINNLSLKSESSLLYTLGRGLLFELDLNRQHSTYLGLDQLGELFWSEKNKTLFTTRYQSDKNLWSYDMKNGQTLPFMHSTRKEQTPSVSRDGKHLVFISNRSGRKQIWLGNRQSTQPKQLTYFKQKGTFGSKSWSPDSKNLAFIRKESDQFELWLINIATNKKRLLLESKNFVEFPQWNEKGDKIYFTSNKSGKNELWTILLKEGSINQLTSGIEDLACGRLSITGDTLYYTKIRQNGLWRKSLPNGEAELLICELDWKDFYNWELKPQAIFFPSRTKKSLDIARISLLTSKVSTLLQLPSGNQSLQTQISVDASGNYIYYDQLDLWDTDIFAVKLEAAKAFKGD